MKNNSAVCAVKVKDTIKRADSESLQIFETLNRSELWQVQTPQIFRFKDLLKAHENFAGNDFTDDAALMEKSGHKVFLYEGSYKNIKITTSEDILTAQALIC